MRSVPPCYGENTLWVGTSDGLSRLKDGKFTSYTALTRTYTTQEGLSSNIVLTLLADASGNLWVGTPNGLNRLREGIYNLYVRWYFNFNLISTNYARFDSTCIQPAVFQGAPQVIRQRLTYHRHEAGGIPVAPQLIRQKLKHHRHEAGGIRS